MITSLPQDLIEEILYRVTVTSLRQLRATCKRWYHEALFKDPRFIKKYFDKRARQYHDALMLIDYRVCSMSSVIDRLPTMINLSLGGHCLTVPHCKDPVDLSEAFHCDGILLITNLFKMNMMIVVWNPFSGQTRWIQVQKHDVMEAYALGYDNKELCRSYKILRFPFRCAWNWKTLDVSPEGDIKLKIYEFSSDSWRNLDAVVPDQAYFKPAGGVSLNGNTYWVSCDKKGSLNENTYWWCDKKGDNVVDYSLLSFDFSTERFQRLCAPPLFHHEPCLNDTIVLSVVREEHLSFFYQSRNTLKVEIWLTDEIIDETTFVSWSKFLTVDLTCRCFTYLMSFIILDEEKKVVVCCDKYGCSMSSMVWITVRGEEEEEYRATPSISVSRGLDVWGIPFVSPPRLLGYVPKY